MTADQELAAAPTSDPYRSLVRLIAGGVSIGADRIQELDTVSSNAVPSDEEFRSDWESVLAAFVGIAAEAPERVAGALGTARQLAAPVGAIAKPVASAMATTFVGRVVASLGESAAGEAGRLAALGRTEIGRGRELATAIYGETVDSLIGDLSGRDALDELVADQAMGVTRGAVQEVRETGAAADWLTESIFRGVFRRPRRPVPPRPADAM